MPGSKFADRTIFAHAITHLDERALDRAGHSVEQLKLETALSMPSCSAQACACAMLRTLCEPKAAVTIDFVLEQNARAGFEIRVALRLLQEDGADASRSAAL